MLNTIRGWLINLLSPSYRLLSAEKLTAEEIKFLTSSEHDEFKKILFKAMKIKANENISLLVKGSYKTERECGNIQGAIRALVDIEEMTKRLKKIETKSSSYVDSQKIIAQDVMRGV